MDKERETTRFLYAAMVDDVVSKRSYRTIWISDLHLGTRACKAECLLDFLRRHECERLYLVGDVFDCWRLKERFYWPPEHNTIVQKILRKARKGTQVIYIPGNHDDGMRDYVNLHFGGVRVIKDAVHRTRDGRRLLVLHGDKFDMVVMNARWVAALGSWSYEGLVTLNSWFNAVRRVLGFPYWSLASYVKQRIKRVGNYKASFEEALVREARRRHVDGIICGHIHWPEHRVIGEHAYYNMGDWVESCSALVEHEDGRLEIITWPDVLPSTTRPPAPMEHDEALATD